MKVTKVETAPTFKLELSLEEMQIFVALTGSVESLRTPLFEMMEQGAESLGYDRKFFKDMFESNPGTGSPFRFKK